MEFGVRAMRSNLMKKKCYIDRYLIFPILFRSNDTHTTHAHSRPVCKIVELDMCVRFNTMRWNDNAFTSTVDFFSSTILHIHKFSFDTRWIVRVEREKMHRLKTIWYNLYKKHRIEWIISGMRMHNSTELNYISVVVIIFMANRQRRKMIQAKIETDEHFKALYRSKRPTKPMTHSVFPFAISYSIFVCQWHTKN